MRQRWVLGVVALFLIGSREAAAKSLVGTRQVPPAAVQPIDGKEPLTRKAKEIRVYHFSASWCPPCIKDFPALEALQKEFERDGVVVATVAMDPEPEKARTLLGAAKGIRVLSDPRRMWSLTSSLPATPATIVVDEGGVVRKVFSPMLKPQDAVALTAAVARLVEEAQAPPPEPSAETETKRTEPSP